MNQFGQQGSNGMSGGMGQQNRYQPSGFVQSHYQGIPKQAGNMSAQSNTGPVISHLGYSANNGYGQSSSMNSSQMHGSQPVLSHYGGSSNNMSSQPVISHYGGYQAQNAQQQQQQSQSYRTQASTSYMNQQSQPVISHFGGYQAQNMQQSQQSQPYQSHALTSYANQQSQPVISHYGGYQAQNAQQQNAQHQSSFGSGGYGATQFTSQAGSTPVLQHSGFSNQGPVISRHGFTANSQNSGGYQQ
ncbi:hypothetical protein GXP70_19105 [Paenibacillus lycopersici]|uniref:Uncharacterized protein n=1 Tax=Paenibacillus lycopersici TaxID=2704462 RepID=A0A6C0G0K4_9BACL|nr:hypothetical protein [Paenibacillus lycopersici]QHT61882.1 hypothetical protein GXP70_19105 [Paenibacillus lycopersici]